jgi:hypothetical protein
MRFHGMASAHSASVEQTERRQTSTTSRSWTPSRSWQRRGDALDLVARVVVGSRGAGADNPPVRASERVKWLGCSLPGECVKRARKERWKERGKDANIGRAKAEKGVKVVDR